MVCCDVAVQDVMIEVNDPSSAWLHARCCHGLTVEGHLTQSPTPRRLRRPNHPNLFLLGFRT